MSIKVAINGFGRIGRMVVRRAIHHPEIEIVGINDLCPADYLAYMLKYDTMHGKFDGEVKAEGNNIIINGKSIPVSAERDPHNLPWKELGAEYVIESTGLFLTKEKAQGHIDAGAKHVVMSAPSKDDTPMFVVGVNQDKYTSDMKFVSNASCTTNCLAPIAKVLNDSFGRPLHHRHAEDCGWRVFEGLAGRPRRFRQHHSLFHRRCQGRGQGDPGAVRQAHRHEHACAHTGRVRGGPHREPEEGCHL